MMWFRGLKRMSLVDYPGKVSAIVFTGGCNFRCPWCYVRDLVLNYNTLPKISEKYVLNYLKSNEKWIDALVISGGEATIHKELPDFIKKVKGIGFMVGLETNGSNPVMLKFLIRNRLIDYVEMDVKAPLSNYELYRKMTGAPGLDIGLIKKSINIIMKSKIKYAFRTTVVPTLLKENDVVKIAKEIKGARMYYLQQFKPMDSVIDKKFMNVKPYSIKTLTDLKKKCKRYVNTELRGI